MSELPVFNPDAPMPDAVRLREAKAWIFDLDNTLYSAEDNLFMQVGEKIRDYIVDFLGLEPEAAHDLQKRYFHEYGTSLRGLMLRHQMDPGPYLEFVHDIDLSEIQANPELDKNLELLSGRKIVFTNADRGHAERVLDRLGISRHFEAIFDIADADYIPKPDPLPYESIVSRLGLKPSDSIMIDDIARNLGPAALLGMTTVWLRNDTDWGQTGADDGHVHHVAGNLTAWLGAVVS
ncbi:MAG: pyrimidine 5'-nucleotidase [Rhodospirillales bacterium]|nr:pyrimidine 5'-nucleotidase [Rhodospirillales bacterium]